MISGDRPQSCRAHAANQDMETPSEPRRDDTPLQIGEHRFESRLFVGTGKYDDLDVMREALEASGSQCITVAVRRLKLGVPEGKTLLDYIDTDRYVLLPNTAGCFTADDAVRTARLGREAGMSDLVKLEVLGDKETLLPDPVGTLEAARTLVDEGFCVLCYTSDDPILAKRLEDVGVAAVMPAGAPIGSGQGILNANNLRIILERATVPILVDAGVGTASDVAVAMELGSGRCVAQHRDREGQRPGPHGARDERWVRGRTRSLARGPDGQEALRDGVVSDFRHDRVRGRVRGLVR